MRFSVIYSDPAWRFTDKRPGRGGCAAHYDTMSDAEIRELPVQSIAAEDCTLFLWVPCAKLDVGLSVIRSWGFRYRTTAFVWVKRGASGKLAWGNGAYSRANAELCLLGVRGHPKVVSHAVHQVIEAPRGEHSAKPAEARRRIEQLMGDVRRVELFAREAVPGWSRWGLEAPEGEGLLELTRRTA